MSRSTACFALALLLVRCSPVFPGSINGVVQELRGTKLRGVRITVINLANGQRVGGPVFSGDGGVFSVDLPSGAAVSVTFDNSGSNEPAALIGISGDVVLNDFKVFMPVPKKSWASQSTYCPRRQSCWRRR